MANAVDYYLGMASPWSFLGGGRLADLAATAGAEVHVYPIKLGAVFGRTGGLPLPKRSPERQAYRLVELQRWRDALGVPLNLHPRHFPVPDDSLSAHAVIAARETGADALALATAIGKSLWVDDHDITDRAVVADAAASVGIDLAALEPTPEFASAADVYERDTENAIAKGVFAVPMYIYADEMFWGQDRLDFLARAMTG